MAIKPRPVRPAGWWYDLALLAALVALTAGLIRGPLPGLDLLGIDVAVRDWVDAHRPPAAEAVALVLNFLGQGGWVCLPLAGGLAIAVAWRTGATWPALPVAGAFLLTGVTVLPLKLWTDRGYPHNTVVAHPEQLFSDAVPNTAYPSGHATNAVVWYGVALLLLRALLAALDRPPPGPAAVALIRVAPPAIVFCTTTYLGHHWITDSIAGLLLGLLIDRVLARVPYRSLVPPRWRALPARLAPLRWRRPLRG